jgi:hypothetical protein
MTDTDLAYIAGLMDGEAYIGVKKTRAYACQGRVTAGYHARIQIRMVDEAAIRFIAETLGGWYYKEKRVTPNRRELYCYQASDKRAETILSLVLPFLKVKRTSAETVLALRALQKTGQQHRTKTTGHRQMPHWTGNRSVEVESRSFSDEYIAACEAYYVRCRALNHAEAT